MTDKQNTEYQTVVLAGLLDDVKEKILNLEEERWR